MGSLDSVCSEETQTANQNSRWCPRDAPGSSATLAGSSDSTTSSSDDNCIPPTPGAYLKSKRRLCDSSSNSPKRLCWSGTGDEEDVEEQEPDSSPSLIPPSLTSTSYETPDLDFCEISLTEDMNSLLRQEDSTSFSSPPRRPGGTSTEDEDDTTTPLRASRRSFGRTVILSSDDSDFDLVLGSPTEISPSMGSSSSSSSSVHRTIVTRARSQTNSRERMNRAFSQTSSSGSERSGGTVFHGRRCRQRIFLGKKSGGRGRDESSSPSSSQGPNELDPIPLQQDLTSPHTPRRSRIFSSRRYHHVSPRARLEERTSNQGSHAPSVGMFSGSPTFRRDDPGRRPLTRSSHSAQRRSVRTSSPPNHNFCRYTESMPDVFDADSDESTEFFTAGSSPSEGEERRRRVSSGSPARANGDAVTFASSDSGLRGDGRLRRRRQRFSLERPRANDNSDEDVRVVFPTANFSPNFHSSSGRRQRRGTRSRRRPVSSEREISSPDPVQQVQQMEDDERMARQLQAQFDAETRRPPVPAPVPIPAESDDDILVDSSEVSSGSSDSSILSSEASARLRPRDTSDSSASSSSRSEENAGPQPYARRGHRNAVGNWRRRGASQRNWQVPRAARRSPHSHANHLINILAFSVSQSGSEDYDYEVVGDVVPRGLIPQQLNRLPTRHYVEDEGKSKECQVCLSEFEKQDLLRILPCFHEFHAACIDKWLPTNRTCPVCRAEVEVD